MINYLIDKLKRDNQETKAQITQQANKLESAFDRIRRVQGVVNVELGWGEIIITTQNYNVACSIENTLYNGSLTIQKAPVPGTNHWEIRVNGD